MKNVTLATTYILLSISIVNSMNNQSIEPIKKTGNQEEKNINNEITKRILDLNCKFYSKAKETKDYLEEKEKNIDLFFSEKKINKTKYESLKKQIDDTKLLLDWFLNDLLRSDCLGQSSEIKKNKHSKEELGSNYIKNIPNEINKQIACLKNHFKTGSDNIRKYIEEQKQNISPYHKLQTEAFIDSIGEMLDELPSFDYKG